MLSLPIEDMTFDSAKFFEIYGDCYISGKDQLPPPLSAHGRLITGKPPRFRRGR
jgi:hypothetical protein